MFRIRSSLLTLSTLSLIGCTTNPPVIDHTHPASAKAAESVTAPMPRMLVSDAATQRTRELLAQRAAEAKAAEAGAGAPNEADGSSSGHSGHHMPGMKEGAGHEHH
jgi:hypothetical protein